ncbi:MAG: cation:proton antiporter [Stappiaceae bacterium]
MSNLPITLSVVAGLLIVIGLIQPLARTLGLSSSVLLAAVGICIGIGSGFLLYTDKTDAFNDIAWIFVHPPVNSEIFLYIFLPILLFQTSLTLDVRRMSEDAGAILTLAVIAVLIATAFIGITLAQVSSMPLMVCLLLGAIVATTDPVAVVAIFRDIGAPARLGRLVEGESLLNDAAAIALFTVVLTIITVDAKPGIAESLLHFSRIFVGGVLGGYIGVRLLNLLLPLVRELPLAQMTLSLALPYLVYVINEQIFDVSGVIGVVTAALYFNLTGPSRISPDGWRFLKDIWEQLAFWSSSLIFILASILVPKLIVGITLWHGLMLLVLIVAALAARAVVLFGLLPILSFARMGERISSSFKLVMLWGGMRGAVTLALALSVTEHDSLDDQTKQFVAILATGFVLFTLLVNGTTLKPLIRLLKLNQLSPLDLALRKQVLALANDKVTNAVEAAAETYHIAPSVAREVGLDNRGRSEKFADQQDIGTDIADRDLITLGLVALADKERECILVHFQERTVSSRIINALLAQVGRLSDHARTGGRVDYRREARRMLGYNIGFRFSKLLQRAFHINFLLAGNIADRFEQLLLSRKVLDELIVFTEQTIATLHGRRVAEILLEILQIRLRDTSKALDALRLQYPDYSDKFERLFIKKTALRVEEMEYQALFSQGLIGQELYGTLRSVIDQTRRDADIRPRLDLGLKSQEMIKSFPIFTKLKDREIKLISKAMRPRFAVPDEVLIRRGSKGDAIFFISSGAAEVVMEERRIRLGRGDFFGEMALIANKPRTADVVAMGFCHLLALPVSDFNALLVKHPDLKAHIDGIVENRIKMNKEALVG